MWDPLSENRDLHLLTKPVLPSERDVYTFFTLEALCLFIPPGCVREGMLALVLAPSCRQQQQSTIASMEVTVHIHTIGLLEEPFAIGPCFVCVHEHTQTAYIYSSEILLCGIGTY